jgi:hypothetical protein
MNALELANYELSYSYPGKVAVDVRKISSLESEIILSDGGVIKANGLIAYNLNNALRQQISNGLVDNRK